MSNRTLLKADELDLPTTAGTGVSFTEATLVRLVNTTASTNIVVTVQETRGGNGVGTFTMPGGSVEYLEKVASHTVFASVAGLRGVKVGFTG
jgi:hypothetical protein